MGLADLVMGSRATKAQRPLLVGAGVIAANFPDIDVAYSIITPAPVGYLLHHRGHTHTIAGLVLLGLALVGTYWFARSVRKMRVSELLRFWLLIAAALASHLALDALNNYGVHPYYPGDNRWRYGDALFIFEPWLWVILGVAVAWNGRTRATRLAAAVPLLIGLGAIASTGIVPLESAAALAIVGGVFAWMSRGLSPPVRAAAAFALCGLMIAGLIGTSRIARRAVADALAPEVQGPLVDLALTPNPSSPLCWGAIAIEMREGANEYVLWKGTLSLAPGWRAPATCASHWFDGAPEVRTVGGGRLTLERIVHQPLPRLRALAERDCWVQAWLRFG
ncbi:MAG TPA: metal-dependent hydrolase, partial [Vicinamibacterales bacterium]|nr:metal-dependent hydrolase [Vicinamibacterales bacterium]